LYAGKTTVTSGGPPPSTYLEEGGITVVRLILTHWILGALRNTCAFAEDRTKVQFDRRAAELLGLGLEL
jgi:hypothetical protein